MDYIILIVFRWINYYYLLILKPEKYPNLKTQ